MPASNTSQNADQTVEEVFEDIPGAPSSPADIAFQESVTVPMSGSINTPATRIIGKEFVKASDRERSDSLAASDVGTSVLDVVQMLGEGQTILDFDANRQGKNVKNITHFSRMNTPLVSINRERFDTRSNQVNHVASFNLFGMPKLFKSFDEISRKPIPFEDFPGRLDPVAFVEAGNYILQYMIVTDLTRDIDKFINPDTLDGAIEVFEIRESFANTSISDIKVKGVKGSLSNENFYATGQGASPIDNKFEIDQISNSIFEDSQDALYQGVSFSPREGYALSGSFALDGPVPDEDRRMSPYTEDIKNSGVKFQQHLSQFLGSSYIGAINSEDSIPELGTRSRSANAGFIGSPNYVIIASGSFINAGTDSIAFLGMSRS